MIKNLLILVVSSFILVGCGDESKDDVTEEHKNEIEVEENNNEYQENDIEQEKKNVSKEEPKVSIATEEIISKDKLVEVIGLYGMGEDDELVNVSQENGEIKAVINVLTNGLFPQEILAATLYSQLSDELLVYDGWSVLTINYVDVGEISMNRSEKESNEYGDYFPTEKIDELLGVEY